MTGMESENHWHLDKRVPVAIIFAIVVQTAGVVWFAATISARVSFLEDELHNIFPQADRLTRAEEQIIGLRDDVKGVEGQILRLRDDVKEIKDFLLSRRAARPDGL